MSQGWENVEPAPIEFFHGRLQEEFHKFRKQKTEDTTVSMDGIEFNRIVVAAKKATKEKYPKQDLDRVIPKSEM